MKPVALQHASFDRQGGQWTITDLGSTNGTQVNGQRLPPNQPLVLQPGARVRLGDVECIFEVS